VGRNDIEPALKRLDQLTQEEARMAAAQILMLTYIVDNKVTTVMNGTSGVIATRGSLTERAYVI